MLDRGFVYLGIFYYQSSDTDPVSCFNQDGGPTPTPSIVRFREARGQIPDLGKGNVRKFHFPKVPEKPWVVSPDIDVLLGISHQRTNVGGTHNNDDQNIGTRVMVDLEITSGVFRHLGPSIVRHPATGTATKIVP
jgi:hypothetical protein